MARIGRVRSKNRVLTGTVPVSFLMDGMKDFSILSAFGEQEVNASLEGRELSAVQQADGTWQSRAFTMTGDGSFQRITDSNPTWQWPAFRAMFCATDLLTADKLPTKYQLDANGEEGEDDYTLPNPDSYQGDNDGEVTGIAPVIHTVNLDGTERWFDLNGRQLNGKPVKKGVYINKGNKVVIK